jgi:F0F1-type ATP synthase assembly protein I
MATELPVVLVACVIVGAAAGIGLDHLLHSRPFCMIVFGILGFAAGVREILRRLGKGSNGGSGAASK